MLHQQPHAVGGDRAGGFIPRHDEQQEEIAEFIVGQRLVLDSPVEQYVDDVVLWIGPVLGGQFLGDHEHLHHRHIALVFGGGEFGVVRADHDIGQLKQAPALVQGYAHQLTDGNQRQLRRHVLNELAAATLDGAVENIFGDFPKARLVGVHLFWGKGIADQAAVLQVLGWIHIDHLQLQQGQHVRFGFMQ